MNSFFVTSHIEFGKLFGASFYDNTEEDESNPIRIKIYSQSYKTKEYENPIYEKFLLVRTENRKYSYKEVEMELFYWDFETFLYVIEKLHQLKFYLDGRSCSGKVLSIRFSQKFIISFCKSDVSNFVNKLKKLKEKYIRNGLCKIEKGINTQNLHIIKIIQ